jgi:hypothetical protein
MSSAEQFAKFMDFNPLESTVRSAKRGRTKTPVVQKSATQATSIVKTVKETVEKAPKKRKKKEEKEEKEEKPSLDYSALEKSLQTAKSEKDIEQIKSSIVTYFKKKYTSC